MDDTPPPPVLTAEETKAREDYLDFICRTTFYEVYGPAARTVLWRSSLRDLYLLQNEYQYILFNWRLPNDRRPIAEARRANQAGIPSPAAG